MTHAIIDKLEAFWQQEEAVYQKAQSSYNEGFVDAIEECIGVVRQHQAEALKTATGEPTAAIGPGGQVVVSGALSADPVPAVYQQARDEMLAGWGEDEPAGGEPAPQDYGDIYRAGFLVNLADLIERTLQRNDDNYCDAAVEVFEHFRPYLSPAQQPAPLTDADRAEAVEVIARTFPGTVSIGDHGDGNLFMLARSLRLSIAEAALSALLEKFTLARRKK